MKGRWLPFLASTAALALAVVAPAQDRSRGRSGGGGGAERSSPSRGSERSAPSRSDQGSRSGPGVERREPPRRDDSRERPPVGRDDRRGPSGPQTGGDSRPTRPSGGDRPSRPSGGDRPTNNERPSNTDRPTRNDYPTNGGRNPFDRTENRDNRGDRSNGGNRDDRRGNGGFDRGNGALGRPTRNWSSRSGVVSYGSIHNGYGNARPTRYGGAPWRGSLSDQIRRTRPASGFNVTFGSTYGGLRIGYVGYSNAWCDDYFAYPYYVFNPWQANGYCVASPWYRYSYLPAYVSTNRVIVVNNYAPTWGTPGWYDYSYDRTDRRNEALNDSLDDLRDAFERNSTRYAERLVPQSGQVAIYNDGRYDYSIGADDFRDMFLDGVEQSKTTKYQITEVQTRGDEVHIRARHEYEDSWGEKQVVYHTMTLHRERDGFVIREFGTE